MRVIRNYNLQEMVNSVITMFLANASPVMAFIYGLSSQIFTIPIILLLIAGFLAILSIPTYIIIKRPFKLTE
ncbi:MAG: hypothetical protein QXI38_03540, partial [Conexivisphaerales archaeon]